MAEDVIAALQAALGASAGQIEALRACTGHPATLSLDERIEDLIEQIMARSPAAFPPTGV